MNLYNAKLLQLTFRYHRGQDGDVMEVIEPSGSRRYSRGNSNDSDYSLEQYPAKSRYTDYFDEVEKIPARSRYADPDVLYESDEVEKIPARSRYADPDVFYESRIDDRMREVLDPVVRRHSRFPTARRSKGYGEYFGPAAAVPMEYYDHGSRVRDFPRSVRTRDQDCFQWVGSGVRRSREYGDDY